MNEQIREGYRSGEFVFRSAEGEAGVIEGRVVPYNVWARIDSFVEGRFYERFMPRSLSKSLLERGQKLRVLFEHGMDRTMGNMPIAALEDVRDEDDGIHYRASLVRGLPEHFMDGMRRGLYGSSVRHKPLQWDSVRKPRKSDHNPEGWEERSITEAKVQEFSVVTFPAYEGATASMRSLTDDVRRVELAALALHNPALLLESIREAQTEEPTHSEPATEEADDEPESAEDDEQPAAKVDTGSRDTQPTKPKKDWLSTEKEAPSWHIP